MFIPYTLTIEQEDDGLSSSEHVRCDTSVNSERGSGVHHVMIEVSCRGAKGHSLTELVPNSAMASKSLHDVDDDGGSSAGLWVFIQRCSASPLRP